MKRSPVPLLAVALALLAAGAAQAGPISWDISWTSRTGAVSSGTSKIKVLGGADSGPTDPGEVAPTSAAFLTYSSKSAAANSFTGKSFDLTAKVTDTDSGMSQNLTFTLNLDGGLSKSGQTISVTFSSAEQVTGVLGTHVYHVQLTSYTAPPFYPTNPFVPGVVLATVTSVNKPEKLPEPGTLLLAGLALPTLGLAGWRRRRAAA
jgi:hypothetical protein